MTFVPQPCSAWRTSMSRPICQLEQHKFAVNSQRGALLGVETPSNSHCVVFLADMKKPRSARL